MDPIASAASVDTKESLRCFPGTDELGRSQKIPANKRRSSKEATCEICHYSAENPRAVGVHRFRAHGVLKPSNRRRPEKVTTGEELLRCHQCRFECKSKISLAIHLNQAHKGNGVDSPSAKVAPKSEPSWTFSAAAADPAKVGPTKKPDGENLAGDPSPKFDIDILNVNIQCTVCKFICNSLKAMGEHVAKLHPVSNSAS